MTAPPDGRRTAPDPATASDGRDGFTLTGGPVGCLMIHGWSGHPGEMRPMAEYLHAQGLTVHVPQLPGHDGTPDALDRVSFRDWIAAVTAAWTALRRDHPTSCVVGFSMGGTLTLDLAARRPGEVAGVVSLSAVTRLAHAWQSLALPLGRHVVRWYYPFSRASLRNPAVRARIAGQVPGLALDAITPAEIERIRAMTRVSVGAAYQLQMLARAVRPRLAQVQAPLLIMHGRLDRVVAPRCAQEIYARAGSTEKELVWLERSGHMTPLDVDRQEAWERAARFIAAHTTAGELREPAQPWR